MIAYKFKKKDSPSSRCKSASVISERVGGNAHVSHCAIYGNRPFEGTKHTRVCRVVV